ncbi:MAG: D-alanyl-D-alanine carboxypeptidase, partial [Clostridiales bacterium]
MKKAFLMILLLFLCYFALSTSALALAPDLQSEAAVLMDGKTGQILWAQNMDAKEYPASITKILTAYLAVEMGSTDEVLTMSRNAVFSIPRGSSHIALDEGEAIVLKDALAALMTVSANDV